MTIGAHRGGDYEEPMVRDGDEDDEIPNTTDVKAGTTGWGFSLDSGETFQKVWRSPKIGTAAAGVITNISVVFGISTSATVTPGSYSATVVYTATTTDS